MIFEHRRGFLGASLAFAAAATAGLSIASPAQQEMAGPAAKVEGLITGGNGRIFAASAVDLKPYGYTEQEYLISGKAHAFQPAPGTSLTADGRWTFVPAGPDQPYRTRMIVRRPPAAKFNGTVVIEFMQEYFSREADTNFRWNAETFLRNGFGWVGVSLHREGVNGPPPGVEFANYTGSNQSIKIPLGPALTKWDPARYGSLSIPDSEMSYDILSQVARAVGPDRPRTGVDPFQGLKVRHVMAVGDTIAGARLTTYINGVQQSARAINGFVIKDAMNPLRLGGTEQMKEAQLRTDVNVPVIQFWAAGPLHVPLAEGPMLRVWNAAGSGHTTGPYMQRVAKTSARDLPGALSNDTQPCAADFANNFPVQYISGSAIMWVHRWMNGGAPAPHFPPVEAGKEDEHGNMAGGIRTPWVDVPIARYDIGGTCLGTAGRTFWFDKAKLKSLYGTPGNYLRKFTESARRAESEGILQKADADAAIRDAAKVTF